MAFTDTLEWPKCDSDKATVGSVVCTVYTDGQPYKPCVQCETGFKHIDRVPTVREKSGKNEKSSRSGKSQGILS